MVNKVQTPITQAMREGALSRRELKNLMQRSDKPALIRLAGWVVLLLLTGSLVYAAQQSQIGSAAGLWLLVPAMFIHGVVLVHHFSLQHECCHYTAFKTRWLNDLVGTLCALVIMLPHRFFRYEHCDHHTYTQVTDRDPEMIDLPRSFLGYVWYLSSIPYWKAKFSELFRHARGRLNSADKRFVPREEHRTVIVEARLMLLFYFVLFSLALFLSWDALLWYWIVPVVLGEPVMRAIRMTEHVGRPTARNMKINTRSNTISAPLRFLCWNMNYHAEHHYASSVPFHALPKLHRKLRRFVYREHGGYLGAHRDILLQVRGRKPRADGT